MAFIRKRGGRYYLVHNVRNRDGKVRQVHLAPLGSRPRISDQVIEIVTSKHALVQVDWPRLKERVSRELVQPFKNDARYLRELLVTIQNVNLDIADLHLPVLEATIDADLAAELIVALKLLRNTLDVKLGRRGRSGVPRPRR